MVVVYSYEQEIDLHFVSYEVMILIYCIFWEVSFKRIFQHCVNERLSNNIKVVRVNTICEEFP